MIVHDNIDGRSRAHLDAKKGYEAPQLMEWGSILDLTQGIKLAPKDFPLAGGTRNT
jgi:hypothetical protein